MAVPDHHFVAEAELLETLSGVLTLSFEPSAVINGSDEILSCNSTWPQTYGEGTPAHYTLHDSLADFEGVDQLLSAIRAGKPKGEYMASGSSAIVSKTTRARQFDAHWRQFSTRQNGTVYTVIVLRPIRWDVPNEIRIGSDRLIVRQSLIEECERLRIGRALHDTVLQDLAWIKKELVSRLRADSEEDVCVSTIDLLLERVRTLSFELSPPLLEDVGLIATLQWLGEHIEERYGVNVSVVADGDEPSLHRATKTIVFRCVRELAINAAKHSSGGDIVISCKSEDSEAVFQVRDFGQGFDVGRACSPLAEHASFGLISVEQQIRGIGAAFELVSETGSGTRATIRVPLRVREGVSVG